MTAVEVHVSFYLCGRIFLMASMSFRAVKLLPLFSGGSSAAGAASASARATKRCRAADGHERL